MTSPSSLSTRPSNMYKCVRPKIRRPAVKTRYERGRPSSVERRPTRRINAVNTCNCSDSLYHVARLQFMSHPAMLVLSHLLGQMTIIFMVYQYLHHQTRVFGKPC